jgi:hypothetical protein
MTEIESIIWRFECSEVNAQNVIVPMSDNIWTLDRLRQTLNFL